MSAGPSSPRLPRNERGASTVTLLNPPEELSRSDIFAKLSDGPVTSSPHRRRATIATRTLISPARKRPSLELSPSKRREKSKSQNDLQTVGLGRAITPINRLEFEIEQRMSSFHLYSVTMAEHSSVVSKPAPVPRLASLVDPSLFIGDNGGSRSPRSDTFVEESKVEVDDLTAPPEIVDPYPQRPQSKSSLLVDTPAMRHLEGVYDR